MGFTASMARRVVDMKNNTATEIEDYILQCACQGGRAAVITEINPLYESAISNHEKLLDMGYKVDKYQYGNTEYSGINSIVISWGGN